MAPKYRQLHTKTLDSFDFNEMEDDFTRVCWLLLPLIVDSAGRGILNSAWIRSKMFPLRQDVAVEQIERSFQWLLSREMILEYEVDNRNYFYIPTWQDYQTGISREADSLLPEPPQTRQPLTQNLPDPQNEVAPDKHDSNSGLTHELVRTNSGVAQELLRTYSRSDSDSDSDSNTDSDSDADADTRASLPPPEPDVPEDQYDHIQRVIERVIGLPQGLGALDAIKKLIHIGATEDDIRAGAHWLKEQGIVIRYAGQLVGPTTTALARRKQESSIGQHSPPRKTGVGLTAVDLMLAEALNGS